MKPKETQKSYEISTKTVFEIMSELSQPGVNHLNVYCDYGSKVMGVSVEDFNKLPIAETSALIQAITDSVKLFS